MSDLSSTPMLPSSIRFPYSKLLSLLGSSKSQPQRTFVSSCCPSGFVEGSVRGRSTRQWLLNVHDYRVKRKQARFFPSSSNYLGVISKFLELGMISKLLQFRVISKLLEFRSRSPSPATPTGVILKTSPWLPF